MRNPLLGGVPMNCMNKWAGAFPVFVKSASGAHFTDVDGHDYVELCLGDTAMAGHSPQIVARRVREGITLTLPTEDALWVGEELQRRFGLPFWQFTLSATDANRFSIRIAREITLRPKILVFHYCYHGTVDESFVSLHNGIVGPRQPNLRLPANSLLSSAARRASFHEKRSAELAFSCGKSPGRAEGMIRGGSTASTLSRIQRSQYNLLFAHPGGDLPWLRLKRKSTSLNSPTNHSSISQSRKTAKSWKAR